MLPLPLDQVLAAVDDGSVRAGRGLLSYLLRDRLRLSLVFHPQDGEVVRRGRRSVAQRLHGILAEHPHPLAIDDILFLYRDGHGAASCSRLLDHLRRDSRFLEVGHERWSLRERHVDELELARPIAEDVRDRIRECAGHTNVRDIVDEANTSERNVHLVIDILRREPSLRELGRGDFCARRTEGSSLVAELVASLRCAMGEVPFSRFLQNHPPSRRRVVAQLPQTQPPVRLAGARPRRSDRELPVHR